ncbi:uncharacterized protein C17orf64 homolog [Varanus komodoensis]|uniref:uncharacterized protein C17orf64 homolog n=1 Tax=Varanus komodoensis TaxID=61221 RepID=UPI001CF797E5|nr:uncharacterized protein C17orf64 homolog [Varanus komodoensis]
MPVDSLGCVEEIWHSRKQKRGCGPAHTDQRVDTGTVPLILEGLANTRELLSTDLQWAFACICARSSCGRFAEKNQSSQGAEEGEVVASDDQRRPWRTGEMPEECWACESRGTVSHKLECLKLTSLVDECLQVTKNRLPTCQASNVPGETLVHYADGLTQDTFKICKEFLRPFKKCLRKLNLPKDFPEEKRLQSTRKNLTILGDHISMFLQHYCKTWELKHWKKMLWRFVSLFSALDEKQLCKLYRYTKTDQTAKFLKAYCRLESLSGVTLRDDGNLSKLRKTWGLHGGPATQEKLSHPKKRLQKSSGRRRKTGTGPPSSSCHTTASPRSKGEGFASARQAGPEDGASAGPAFAKRHKE